jgi:malyl-CoA/(S)-citramalyl-CoA lyase
MSFHIIEQAPARLNRSELAVPGSQPQLFEKAAASSADIVFLDLEDAVAPDDKEAARKNIIQAIGDIDWGTKSLSVRINGLDTHYMYRDVVDVLEQAPDRLDLIMIPKVGTAADVYALDMLVTQVETARGRKKRVGFELIIETALGMQNINEIAAASKRNESLHFGVADYAASTIGARGNHWGDPWHYAISRVVVAARANGLRPIDGPFGNFSDADAFGSAAKRAAVLGCEGKWAIHPSQIALANSFMSPSAAEVSRAERILAAMKAAEAEGKGAVSLDGRLIDYASIRQAEVLVEKARQIAGA